MWLDRFHWEEIYSEKHDDTGIVVPYHRIHRFEVAGGYLGFIDPIDKYMAVVSNV